jgi:HAD superfamily hydrolase (TIGR01509 family)
MIKGFILDIDGTLLESNEAHAKTWAHALEKYGYQVTTDEVRTLIGMGGDRVLPTLVPELHTDEGKGKEIVEYRKKCLVECVAPSLRPTKGAREFVLELKKRGLKLVIATSSSSEELQTLLKQADVDDLLDTYTTSSDVAASKPAPDVVSVARKKIGLAPHEVFMVGDTPYDVASAKKSGIQTIAVRSGGFSDEQLKGATYIFENPFDITKHLDDILHASSRYLPI